MSTRVVLDNRVRLATGLLSEEFIEALRAEFTHSNPKYYQTKKMLGWTREPKEIETWRESGGWISVPLGGWQRVIDLLDEYQVARSSEDRRVLDLHGLKLPEIDCRDYQSEFVEVGLEREVCVMRSPEGTGKTRAGLELSRRTASPTLIMMASKVLVRQWVAGCRELLGIEPDIFGKGSPSDSPVTIAMRQSLINHVGTPEWKKFVRRFGCFIVDEAQTAAADTAVAIIDTMPARYRIGITADERRADSKQSIIYDYLGPVSLKVKRDEMVDRGIIHDAEIRIVPTDFEALWYLEIDEAKRGKHNNRLYDEMVADDRRENSVDKATRFALEDEAGPVVVMSLRREQCFALGRRWASLFNVGYMLGGEEDREALEECTERLGTGTMKLAAATFHEVGVGFDVPRMARAVFAMPVANYGTGRRQWNQYVGRFTRGNVEGKSSVVVYYLWDRKVFGLKPLRNICKWQERVFVLDGTAWANGAEYLRSASEREAAASGEAT